MSKIFLVSALLLSVFSGLSAQKGFKGSFVLGLNASQLDGDLLVGYDKLGTSAGVKVAFDLSDKLAANVELLYNQKGSSQSLFERSDDLDLTATNYFDLPIYLSYGDWYIEKDDYYKVRAHFGFSYGALISTKGQTDLYSFDDFNNSEITYLLGATYAFTKHWALTVRFSRALNKLLKDDTLRTGYLLNYFWTVRAEYAF